MDLILKTWLERLETLAQNAGSHRILLSSLLLVCECVLSVECRLGGKRSEDIVIMNQVCGWN